MYKKLVKTVLRGTACKTVFIVTMYWFDCAILEKLLLGKILDIRTNSEIILYIEERGAVKLMDLQVLTTADIEILQAVELKTADRSTLRDIRDVKIDTTLPEKERFLDYVRQIGNPYCYLHGKYTVKISFSDTDATLEDRMLTYLRSKC